ncbi:MAG: hypothetical protein ACRDV9_14690 [Acidimicrobiia bacterium]
MELSRIVTHHHLAAFAQRPPGDAQGHQVANLRAPSVTEDQSSKQDR